MRLIQAKRASEILNVSLQRLYELARLGIIPVVRLGPRQIRFDEDVLTEWARTGGAMAGDQISRERASAKIGNATSALVEDFITVQ